MYLVWVVVCTWCGWWCVSDVGGGVYLVSGGMYLGGGVYLVWVVICTWCGWWCVLGVGGVYLLDVLCSCQI